MIRACLAICLVCALGLPGAVRADVCTDWNNITLDIIRQYDMRPTAGSRLLAMVHAAIFDAVNGIDRTCTYYCVQARANADSTCMEAAAVAAAYRVLASEMPRSAGALYRAYVESLSYIPENYAKRNGIAFGGFVGSAIVAYRKNDYSNYIVNYCPGDLPGQWRPTPPNYAEAVSPQWGYVRPFVIERADYFLPGPPPDLTSRKYAADLNEVKELGALNSKARTADQTEIAYFWADNSYSISPPGRWNKVAQVISEMYGLSLAENARLFALINMAMADGCVTVWKCKYEYDLWRPITAIHLAATDNNPRTQPNLKWLPLLNTPAFPEYVSGHSTFGGAAAEVLARFFGDDNIAFDLYSEVIDVTRHFESFSQAADENGRSRIYGGLHYEFGNANGIACGRAIGGYVHDNCLLPL